MYLDVCTSRYLIYSLICSSCNVNCLYACKECWECIPANWVCHFGIRLGQLFPVPRCSISRRHSGRLPNCPPVPPLLYLFACADWANASCTGLFVWDKRLFLLCSSLTKASVGTAVTVGRGWCMEAPILRTRDLLNQTRGHLFSPASCGSPPPPPAATATTGSQRITTSGKGCSIQS